MAVQTIVETDVEDGLKVLGWRIGQGGNDVHTNYIIFKNVENFKFYFFQIKKNIVKDNSEWLGIFHLSKWKFQN
jgi:hypothetical protein